MSAFEKYEKEFIHTGMTLNADTIHYINNEYDLFIAGSDQIWNMQITHEDWTYFLDFVTDDTKKISYAPSFGNSTFPPHLYEMLKRQLLKFNHLSVREQSGEELIHKLTDKKASVVVDPTLLLTKEEWIDSIKFVPRIKEYILVYFPHNKKKVFNFAMKLKKMTGLPIVYLSISPRLQKGVTTIYDASPDEFLGWINNAKYVITGSFHGTAFSINLEKQFFYEPSGRGSRIDNLVKKTGTYERSIDTPDIISHEIDYTVVREMLQNEREVSLNWLRNAIGK